MRRARVRGREERQEFQPLQPGGRRPGLSDVRERFRAALHENRTRERSLNRAGRVYSAPHFRVGGDVDVEARGTGTADECPG